MGGDGLGQWVMMSGGKGVEGESRVGSVMMVSEEVVHGTRVVDEMVLVLVVTTESK